MWKDAFLNSRDAEKPTEPATQINIGGSAFQHSIFAGVWRHQKSTGRDCSLQLRARHNETTGMLIGELGENFTLSSDDRLRQPSKMGMDTRNINVPVWVCFRAQIAKQFVIVQF